MSARAKKKPGATLAGATGRKLIASAGYHTLVFRAKLHRFVQKPFCAVCWNIEQRASKLEDRIDNERSDR
jgi:hypothetical protein